MRVTALVLALVAACASACSTAVESTPHPTPPPAAPSKLPGQVLDLTNWNLTLPTGAPGKPDTVQQPALASYSGPFFQVDPGRGGVVFTADAGGVTTKNSGYPRSELRETSGAKLAAWSNRGGTHTLDVRQAVITLPPVKPEVVTAQIHDAEDDVIEIRLEGNRLIAQYANNNAGSNEFVIDPAYVLGAPYDLRVEATAGRIDVFYNGAHAGGVALAGDGWYFKTGSYLQSNVSKGDAADAIGQVVLYAVRVSHTG